MAFIIKHGDDLPHLPFQFFQPDGVTPLDLTTASGVYIVVSDKSKPPGNLTFKSLCTIDDAPNGKGHYAWAAGDTTTAGPGAFQYEFEIDWADGDVQTLPVDSYLDLTIVADLG